MDFRIGLGIGCEDSTETIAFQRETQSGFAGGVFFYPQLGPAVEIEIMPTGRFGNLHLRSFYIVFIAIHYGADSVTVECPAADKDSVAQHWIHRFPIGAP